MGLIATLNLEQCHYYFKCCHAKSHGAKPAAIKATKKNLDNLTSGKKDSQHNNTQHNVLYFYTQHNNTQHNNTQHNNTQHNNTQHNNTQHNNN
jgi:hypothetical protein